MTNNANLKRATRSFMEKHEGVPYLTALKAVDEPLHELRALEANRGVRKVHFRLIGEQSSYSSAFPEWGMIPLRSPLGTRGLYYSQLTETLGLSHFEDSRDFLRESGRRVELFERAGESVYSIWDYRELWRAGLLWDGAPEVEPFFHHFGFHPDQSGRLMRHEGPSLGLFSVATAAYIDLEDTESYFPVTIQELENLKSGARVEDIGQRYPYNPHNPEAVGGTPPLVRLGERFSKMARSRVLKSEGWAKLGDRPRLTVFFREDPELSGVGLRELGLNPDDFELTDVSGESFDFELHFEDFLVSSPSFKYLGNSQGIFEV